MMQKLAVTLIMLLFVLAPNQNVWAGLVPPGSISDITAAEDSYADLLNPNDSQANELLRFELAYLFDQGLGQYCPVVSKITYLKFDLSTVNFPIDKARLNLATVGDCAAQPDNLLIQLIGAGDAWSESSLTWNNQPSAEAIFGQLVNVSGVGFFHWTDDGSSGDDLAAWLAAQQTAQGGDGQATLGLITPVPMGCSENALPSVTAAFETSELFGQSLGCLGEAIPPTLQVADAASELPPPPAPAPTAVTLRQMTAGNAALAWPPALGLGGALLGLGLAGVSIQRARREREPAG